MIGNDDFIPLWRIRKTILEMCNDRGYIVPDLGMTMDDFKIRFGEEPDRSRLLVLVQRKLEQSDRMYCFFTPSYGGDKKLRAQTIEAYSNQMEQDGVQRAILIVEHGVGPSAQKLINQLRSKNQFFEVFKDSELLVNITEHELVPKHEVISDEEKKILMERYRVRESQLPRISKNDPVARYYGLSHGQVVKITRTSETAGRYVTYRIVI
ncbi:uncharacterized protein LOC135121372 [Zophobas morio]|uniref:uncharacterized protein LOC135121372 n=1 Tax=Zophobas morio TaxID=2755281 RepID=UPI003083ADB7